MARSRGEIPVGRGDSSPGDDQHVPREVPSISPTMETSDRSTQHSGDSRNYTSNRPTDWSTDRPAHDGSAVRSRDRSTYRSGDDSARDRPARDRSAYRSGDDSARDRPARDRSAYRSRGDSARDRPARDRSACRSRGDSAHEHAGCRNDLCGTRLSRSAEPPNRNTLRASSNRNVRRKEERESEPETGSARDRWESKQDQKRHYGRKTRYCLDGEQELRDKHTRVKSGEEDGEHQTGVSGLGMGKEAFGGGRRARKRNDGFEDGGEVNGVRQCGSEFLSVRDSGDEASGIPGGTSWGGKSSGGSKLGHASDGPKLGHAADGSKLGHAADGSKVGLASDGSKVGLASDGSKLGHASDGSKVGHTSDGDDVEEQQLPSHSLGKKPEFKTSRGNVAMGLKFVSDREEDPHRLAQRQKQIDFGKNTVGYDEYMRKVPIHKRRVGDPVTPDKGEKMSKRRWMGRISNWRRQLHAYDKNPSPNETCNAPPDSDGSEESESGEITLPPSLRSSFCPRESNKGDHNHEQERKEGREEPNVGIYDAEEALDDMFGVRQGMTGSADGERKRKHPESMEGVLSEEDDGEEYNRDESGDRNRPAKMRCRHGAWNGWGMSAKPLKLTKGEPLEHDKLSPTPKGCCIKQNKGTAEFTDMTVTNKNETQPGGFHPTECVTDGGMEENAGGGTISPPVKRNLDGVGTGQQHQVRHLDRIDNNDGLGDPLHSGQGETFATTTTEEAPTKPSEIDWDEVDFSDDDML